MAASHGAPLLQGIEVYRGRPIFYDLGSFFFQTATAPNAYGPEVWQSVIADCRFTKAGVEGVTLIPVQLNAVGENGPNDMKTRGLPSFAEGADADGILKHVAEMSAPFGTICTFWLSPRVVTVIFAVKLGPSTLAMIESPCWCALTFPVALRLVSVHWPAIDPGPSRTSPLLTSKRKLSLAQRSC